MEKRFTLILKTFIGLISSSSLLFYLNKPWFEFLIQEDGVLENLTAGTLLVSSLLILIRFLSVGNKKNSLWKAFNILMIVGLFFGFGEEISWGQRIFEIESSEFFSQNNTQNETNLHNLKINDIKVNRIISVSFSVIFGIYYLFLLWIYKKVSFVKRLVQKIGIPVPTLPQSFFFLVGTLLILTLSHSKKWEIWECIFVLSFLWILIAPYNTEEKLFRSQK